MASDTVFSSFPDVAELFQRPTLDEWRAAADALCRHMEGPRHHLQWG